MPTPPGPTRSLLATQKLFAKLLGQLLVYINENESWAVTMGDVWRPDKLGHQKNSCHYIRLAADLNLFVNGVYQADNGPDYRMIGAFWKNLNPGCRWGGDFKPPTKSDANHFSMTYGGFS